MKEYRINKYLKLSRENGFTVIYVGNEKFRVFKYTLFSDTETRKIKKKGYIGYMDGEIRLLENVYGGDLLKFDPETKFWRVYLNLQEWAEHKYNRKLLDMWLALSLLRKLTDAGDKVANLAFKEELMSELQENIQTVRYYLADQGYLDYLTDVELKEMGATWVRFKDKKFPIVSNILNLSKKGIKSLSEVKGLFNLDELEILILNGNKIKKLPDSIGNLKSLKVLDLRENDLKNLPNSIGDLATLQELYISGNKLKRLPKTIYELKSLKKLDMKSNKFKFKRAWKLAKSLGSNQVSVKFDVGIPRRQW